jgi:3-phosphoshikimate 1-carboxyvinyltransferase
MAAAIAAQRCENAVTITNAQSVAKSYPAFFEDYNSLGGKAYVL